MSRYGIHPATHFARRWVGLLLLCGALTSSALPRNAHAQVGAASASAPGAVALAERGRELRAEVNAEYKRLRVSRTLTRSVHDPNDVTEIVLRFVPVGTPFEAAEAILRAAGAGSSRSPEGHVVARANLQGRLLDPRHIWAVDLAPRAPGDFSVVARVSAQIYLLYLPNADRR